MLIDQETAVAMATEAASALKTSKFSMWQQSIHADIEQLKRIRRSKSVVILCFDSANNQATVLGSEGNKYTTSFSSCSCPDFSTRHLPCKHMYKVAAEHGGIDFSKYI